MIELRSKGDFSKTVNWLKNASLGSKVYRRVLDQYGKAGVSALSAATPRLTGKTASSWSYHIEENGSQVAVVWTNSNIVNYVNIAMILQYGHGTRNGGYVEGIDYINPALRPVFENMANKAWELVIKK